MSAKFLIAATRTISADNMAPGNKNLQQPLKPVLFKQDGGAFACWFCLSAFVLRGARIVADFTTNIRSGGVPLSGVILNDISSVATASRRK